jgi:hypothetical protein
MKPAAASLRVAVITPYYQEALGVLEQCHVSVLNQTHPCVHFLVADGCSQPEGQKWSAEHIVLSRPHRDNGNTPRGIGVIVGDESGFRCHRLPGRRQLASKA